MNAPDDRRARLWAGLGIGPRWLLREPDGVDASDVAVEPGLKAASAEALVEAPVEAKAGVPLRMHEAGPVGTSAASSVQPPDPAPATGDERARAIAAMDWEALQAEAEGCRACGLCEMRQKVVFGVGDRKARWMVVGEAPGADEDRIGEPFVGRAGQLLDSMLAAVGMARNEGVYIANVLKCRPPANRNPQPGEMASCEPFLRRQIELVAPRVIVVVGRSAVQCLLGTDASIASLRGRVHRVQTAGGAVPVVVTYHPAYLLRTPQDKAKSWADLLLARRTEVGAGGV